MSDCCRWLDLRVFLLSSRRCRNRIRFLSLIRGSSFDSLACFFDNFEVLTTFSENFAALSAWIWRLVLRTTFFFADAVGVENSPTNPTGAESLAILWMWIWETISSETADVREHWLDTELATELSLSLLLLSSKSDIWDASCLVCCVELYDAYEPTILCSKRKSVPILPSFLGQLFILACNSGFRFIESRVERKAHKNSPKILWVGF